jgi:hypothetical protein
MSSLVVFRGDLMAELAHGHPGRVGDITDGGLVVPILKEEFTRPFDDLPVLHVNKLLIPG